MIPRTQEAADTDQTTSLTGLNGTSSSSSSSSSACKDWSWFSCVSCDLLNYVHQLLQLSDVVKLSRLTSSAQFILQMEEREKEKIVMSGKRERLERITHSVCWFVPSWRCPHTACRPRRYSNRTESSLCSPCSISKSDSASHHRRAGYWHVWERERIKIIKKGYLADNYSVYSNAVILELTQSGCASPLCPSGSSQQSLCKTQCTVTVIKTWRDSSYITAASNNHAVRSCGF